jgi:hypothetical protein
MRAARCVALPAAASPSSCSRTLQACAWAMNDEYLCYNLHADVW